MSDFKKVPHKLDDTVGSPFDEFHEYGVEVVMDKQTREMGLAVAFLRKGEQEASPENTILFPMDPREAASLAVTLMALAARVSGVVIPETPEQQKKPTLH